MKANQIVITLGAIILALTVGCTDEKEKKVATVCNSNNTSGTVSLTITGNPNDSFRISLICGGQTVTQCTATIPARQARASCNAGPNPVPNGGVRSCPVGPGNNNSPAAAVQTSGCG